MCAAKAMADSDDRTRHLLALYVDEVKEVPGMIEPTRVIAQDILVGYIALPLMRNVGYPDTSDAEAIGFGPSM